MLGNTFLYTNLRRNYGRQCLFSDRNELLMDIPSNYYEFQRHYILRNPVDRGQQLSDQKALSECLTDNAELTQHGMEHLEGGWPKDVNYKDEDQALRHRKKSERDDNWGRQVMLLTAPIVHAMKQNSAVNIYQDYFANTEPLIIKHSFEARTGFLFRNNNSNYVQDDERPIVQLDWSTGPEEDKFLTVNSSLGLFPSNQRNKNFYIWDVNNQLKPLSTLTAPNVTTRANYCPKDESLIAGGLSSGVAALWDSRAAGPPVGMCPLEASHQDAVSALCWVHSKSNTEFYTGSTDGSICYWDGRNLRRPSLEVYLDPIKTDQSRWRSHGCTVLEFEYTIPIKFTVGTDMGYIFLGSRKAERPSYTFIANFRAMDGPIRIIERNPFFPKNFLVIGDWCAKIWIEDCKDYPLIRLPHQKSEILCGGWSTTRSSLFITGHKDGSLNFWDLLLDHKKPTFTMNQFGSSIVSIAVKKTGDILLVGTIEGLVYVVKLDEALTKGGPNDKIFVSAMMERELHRCKLLEGRIREIRLLAASEGRILQLEDDYDDEVEESVNPSESETDSGREESDHPANDDFNDDDDEDADIFVDSLHEEEDEEEEDYGEEQSMDMDPEFTEVLRIYLELVALEKEKNKLKEFEIQLTVFDDGYQPEIPVEEFDSTMQAEAKADYKSEPTSGSKDENAPEAIDRAADLPQSGASESVARSGEKVDAASVDDKV